MVHKEPLFSVASQQPTECILLVFDFLPRDASAERGNGTVSRPSVCLSVCLSVTFRYQQHVVGILGK